MGDHIIPEEDQNDLGRIEHYQCNLCQRRFRNNHDKKEYPGRGSMLCHVATEHGKLLDAMRNDDKVQMQSEIELLNEYEKGKFIEKQTADNVEDKDLVTTKESILWKIRNNKLDNDNIKLSGLKPEVGPLGPRPRKIECPHCNEFKDNSDGSKLRLHIFLHYKDRWEKRVDSLEKGNNFFYCDSCPKRKQLRGANEEGARLSSICHFAIQHHELREVLKKDDTLPENFIKDLYWDIDSKPKDNPTASVVAPQGNKQTPPASGGKATPKQTSKVPEPTRGKRCKAKGNNLTKDNNQVKANTSSRNEKAEWMSSSDEEEDPKSKLASKRKK